MGQWHSLSDSERQEALQIRLDFIAFCGFLLDELPDDTTLCRFRNRLIALNKLPQLLNEINRQFQAHGLMMQKTKGAIVDTTLITSAARPRTEMIVQTDASGVPMTFEDGSQPIVEITEKHSADPDATWVKKSKKSHFGYRVEQFFGTLKRTFDFRRASYIGTIKVNAQMLLKGMCANLLKVANKIQIDCDLTRINPSKNSNIA